MFVQVCPSEHAHGGTHTCYKDHKCRCADCRAHNTASVYAWREQKRAGTNTPTVDASEARAHLLELAAAGMGYRAIADRAGVGYSVIQRTASGVRTRINQLSAECILAVTLRIPEPTPAKNVDATGTRRRLQALTWMGWTGEDLMVRIGKRSEESTRLMTSRLVFAETRDLVSAMYDDLWDVAPADTYGSRRAKLRARRNGWVSPLSWEDETIDDPNAEPIVVDDTGAVDALAIEMAITGYKPKLRTAERHVVVTRLHAIRWSDKKIAGWIGVSDQTVFRDRRELNLAAWEQVDMTGQTGKAA